MMGIILEWGKTKKYISVWAVNVVIKIQMENELEYGESVLSVSYFLHLENNAYLNTWI